MSSFPEPRRTRAAQGGFTLVELLVGLVLAAVFSTVVFQLLRGQSKFTGMQTARQETQQNVRGALELIASELRAVPSGAIERGENNRVRYYLPRAFGVACTSPAGSLVAAFPAVPDGTMPVGDLVAARFGMMAFNAAGRWTASPLLMPRSGVSKVETVALAGNPCATSNVAGDVAVYRFTGTNFPAAPIGTRVALFEVVEYDEGVVSGLSSAGDSLWVQRGSGVAGSQQPLAGPLPALQSLKFRYHARGSDLVLPTPVLPVADIGRVVVHLTTRSRQQASSVPAQQTDSVTVFLRN